MEPPNTLHLYSSLLLSSNRLADAGTSTPANSTKIFPPITPNTSADAQGFPNSCTEIYGSRSTDFRLRMYTSGGFSPDGITGMTPDSYRQYFRLHAQIDDGTGETMTLDEPNVEYAIPLADGTTGRYLRAWVVGEWLGWACRCAPCSPQSNTRSCADVSGWSAAMVHTP